MGGNILFLALFPQNKPQLEENKQKGTGNIVETTKSNTGTIFPIFLSQYDNNKKL